MAPLIPIPYLSLLHPSSPHLLLPIHAHLTVLNLLRYAFVATRLLSLYSSLPSTPPQTLLHFFNLHPSTHHLNLLLRSRPSLAFRFYARIRLTHNLKPNPHTLPVVIRASPSLPAVSQLHAHAVRFGFGVDSFVVSALVRRYCGFGEPEGARRVLGDCPNANLVCWTSLVSGFCGLGRVEEARKVFDGMPERGGSSWSAMVSGYVRNEKYDEAIGLFRAMMAEGLEPNESLLVSVLNACACVGASEMGRWVRMYVDWRGIEYGVEIGTALVDLYAKIGCVESVCEVFGKMVRKDVKAWSAMVMGFAVNGRSREALQVFEEMLKCGFTPNDVTFIGVLSACNHGGLVEEGLGYFKAMMSTYRIAPLAEHYGIVVDLLARAGRICEAEELIEGMCMKPDASIWGALLNGCLMHGHKDVAERVGRVLIELEPSHRGRYVSLANVYASMGKWEGVVKVRRMMRERGVLPSSGWSSIELDDGSTHRFHADDRKHVRSGDVYEVLRNLKDNSDK